MGRKGDGEEGDMEEEVEMVEVEEGTRGPVAVEEGELVPTEPCGASGGPGAGTTCLEPAQPIKCYQVA